MNLGAAGTAVVQQFKGQSKRGNQTNKTYVQLVVRVCVGSGGVWCMRVCVGGVVVRVVFLEVYCTVLRVFYAIFTCCLCLLLSGKPFICCTSLICDILYRAVKDTYGPLGLCWPLKIRCIISPPSLSFVTVLLVNVLSIIFSRSIVNHPPSLQVPAVCSASLVRYWWATADIAFSPVSPSLIQLHQ